MTVRSRLPFEGPRTVSTAVLRHLREVAPGVELFAPNDRQWWLLRHAPDVHRRRQEGQRILAGWGRQYLPHPTHVLMLHGYSHLKTYPAAIDGNVDVIRDDLALMTNRSERELDRDFESALAISDGIVRDRQRIAVLSDYRGAMGKFDHSFFMRGRTSSLAKATFRTAQRATARVLARV